MRRSRIVGRLPAAEFCVRVPVNQMPDQQLLRLLQQQRMFLTIDALVEFELAHQHRTIALQPGIPDGKERIDVDAGRPHQIPLGIKINDILVEINVKNLDDAVPHALHVLIMRPEGDRTVLRPRTAAFAFDEHRNRCRTTDVIHQDILPELLQSAARCRPAPLGSHRPTVGTGHRVVRGHAGIVGQIGVKGRGPVSLLTIHIPGSSLCCRPPAEAGRAGSAFDDTRAVQSATNSNFRPIDLRSISQAPGLTLLERRSRPLGQPATAVLKP